MAIATACMRLSSYRSIGSCVCVHVRFRIYVHSISISVHAAVAVPSCRHCSSQTPFTHLCMCERERERESVCMEKNIVRMRFASVYTQHLVDRLLGCFGLFNSSVLFGVLCGACFILVSVNIGGLIKCWFVHLTITTLKQKQYRKYRSLRC